MPRVAEDHEREAEGHAAVAVADGLLERELAQVGATVQVDDAPPRVSLDAERTVGALKCEPARFGDHAFDPVRRRPAIEASFGDEPGSVALDEPRVVAQERAQVGAMGHRIELRVENPEPSFGSLTTMCSPATRT